MNEVGETHEDDFSDLNKYNEERDIFATVLAHDVHKYVMNELTSGNKSQTESFISNHLDNIEENWRTAINNVCKSESSQIVDEIFPAECILFHSMRLEGNTDPALIKMWSLNTRDPNLKDRLQRARSYIVNELGAQF